MQSDADIWRAARDLIAEQGARRAEAYAYRQMNEMTTGGNFAGSLIWRRIHRAIRGLNGSAAKAAPSAGSRR
jgi:hypothetical protein